MVLDGQDMYKFKLMALFQGDKQRIQEFISYCDNEMLKKIHIMGRRFAPSGVQNENDICEYLKSNLEGVITLDRNILSDMFAALKRGSFTSPNNPNSDSDRKKITAFILWTSLHNMSLLPYWAINEFAHDCNAKSSGNKELYLFNKFFDTITIDTIRESFFNKDTTFQKISFSEAIDDDKFQFDEDDAAFLHLYAAMLHFVFVLNTTSNPDKQFEQFIQWYFDNCLFSRYLVAYIFLYYSQTGIQPPHNYTKADEAIKGCSNMARDIQYIQDLDRIEMFEPELCTKKAFFFATKEDDIWRYFSAGNSETIYSDSMDQYWAYLSSFLNASKQYSYFTICNNAYRTHIMPKVNPQNAVKVGKEKVEKEKKQLIDFFNSTK